jgi:hypothetical protein
VALLALIASPTGSAHAADGALEIHQACALAADGCFAGDLGGFPVTLAQPGAYVLTSDLLVTATDTPAIYAVADGVTIDLNGFEVRGPVTCTGAGPTLGCAPASIGNGISLADRGAVAGGSVRGFGSDGVVAGDRARLRDLLLESNRGFGAQLGASAIVSATRIRRNQGLGILAGPGTVMDGCTLEENGGGASSIGIGSVVVATTARGNGGSGIGTQTGSVSHGGVAADNELDGIVASLGSVVSGNVSAGNGRLGINASNGSAVQRNAVQGNGGFGISMFPRAGYRENTISANGGGTVLGGVDAGSNACDGVAACP